MGNIKMKALRTFQGREGFILAGKTFFADNEARANELEKQNPSLAVRLTGVSKPEVRSRIPTPEVEATGKGPLLSTGGPTGGIAPSPSLEAAPALQKRSRRSPRSKG
jgi:hypothetical protein